MQQQSLFAPALPLGLKYQPDFLGEQEEAELVEARSSKEKIAPPVKPGDMPTVKPPPPPPLKKAGSSGLRP